MPFGLARYWDSLESDEYYEPCSTVSRVSFHNKSSLVEVERAGCHDPAVAGRPVYGHGARVPGHPVWEVPPRLRESLGLLGLLASDGGDQVRNRARGECLTVGKHLSSFAFGDPVTSQRKVMPADGTPPVATRKYICLNEDCVTRQALPAGWTARLTSGASGSTVTPSSQSSPKPFPSCSSGPSSSFLLQAQGAILIRLLPLYRGTWPSTLYSLFQAEGALLFDG